MASWKRDKPSTQSWIDFTPGRCRCGRALLPHEIKCPNCQRGQSLLFSGLDRLYEDDLDKLLAYYETQARKNPGDFMCMHYLAGIHLLKGDYEKAASLYKQVVNLQPAFAESRLNLGVIHAYFGETDDALRELNEYVRLDLHSPRVERVLRAISKIKNVPYEDVAQEKGIKSGIPDKRKKGIPEPGPSLKTRGYRYGDAAVPHSNLRPVRSWGAIDIFLLFLVLIIAAGWYLFPSESKAIMDIPISRLEAQYAFTVTSGETGDDQETGTNDVIDESEEEDTGPVIINANPSTSNWLPLASGNRWEYVIYDTRDPFGNGRRQNEAVLEMSVRGYANRDEGVWEVRNGELTIYFMESPEGLNSVINPDRPWMGKILQIPEPSDINRSVTREGQTVTVMAEEVVETPAGLFNALKLKYELGDPAGKEWYIWYAQGIGIVKYVGMVGRMGMWHVRELSEFELN